MALFNSQKITTETVMRHIYDTNYLGVLKGNTMGTEFILFDNGTNPALIPEGIFDDLTRHELCRITYKSNIVGKKPNTMRVHVAASVSFL